MNTVDTVFSFSVALFIGITIFGMFARGPKISRSGVSKRRRDIAVMGERVHRYVLPSICLTTKVAMLLVPSVVDAAGLLWMPLIGASIMQAFWRHPVPEIVKRRSSVTCRSALIRTQAVQASRRTKPHRF